MVQRVTNKRLTKRDWRKLKFKENKIKFKKKKIVEKSIPKINFEFQPLFFFHFLTIFPYKIELMMLV